MELREWKLLLVKYDVLRYYDFLVGQVIAFVPFMIGWIPQKDTRCRMGLQLIGSCKRKEWKA